MSDIVDRLRAQGADAFHKHYSLGMWQLCAEAADTIETLRRDLDKEARDHTHEARDHNDTLARARKLEASLREAVDYASIGLENCHPRADIHGMVARWQTALNQPVEN